MILILLYINESSQNKCLDDKQWQRERRDEAVKRTQERAKEAEKKKAEQKQELQCFGVKQQMNVCYLLNEC